MNRTVYFIFITLLFGCKNKQQTIDKLINTAKSNIQKKDYDEALKNLNDAIAIYPDTTIIYSLKGKLFYEKHLFDSSKAAFRKVLDYNPKNTAAFFFIGLNYFNQDRNDSAIFYYNKAISTKSNDEVYIEINREGFFGKNYFDDIPMKIIRYYRGVSNYIIDNYRDAYSDFSFAINNKYSLGDSYLYLGIIEGDLKNDSLACKYINLAVKYGNDEAKKYLVEKCK